MREVHTKQACMPAFIILNKVHIVTIISSDISSVTIHINIDLFIQ